MVTHMKHYIEMESSFPFTLNDHYYTAAKEAHYASMVWAIHQLNAPETKVCGRTGLNNLNNRIPMYKSR